MKLEELIQLAQNNKNSLQDKKNLAYMSGNMEEYYQLEEEIKEVEAIITKLQS
jgi:hypothetical protein